MHAEPAESEPAAAHFCLACVVCAPVHQHALCRLKVFLPCLLQMDQRPLAAAEGKVLKAGEGEKLLLAEVHPIRRQVIPAGRAASSTVTE